MIVLIVRFGLRMFTIVKGSSMRETLLNGDVLLTKRYGKREIQRFDIVICRYPGRKGHFVKRIIGMPGERIRMEKDIVYINDEELIENFPKRRCMRCFDEVTVPEGSYFVMGDNRPSSNDSRKVGAIRKEAILARAEHILFTIGRHRRL
ncbi:MAG: signal peptidase I [Clostridia bacterium]|nr:signal peptidase I [Clostridia bacterium]